MATKTLDRMETPNGFNCTYNCTQIPSPILTQPCTVALASVSTGNACHHLLRIPCSFCAGFDSHIEYTNFYTSQVHFLLVSHFPFLADRPALRFARHLVFNYCDQNRDMICPLSSLSGGANSYDVNRVIMEAGCSNQIDPHKVSDFPSCGDMKMSCDHVCDLPYMPISPHMRIFPCPVCLSHQMDQD